MKLFPSTFAIAKENQKHYNVLPDKKEVDL